MVSGWSASQLLPGGFCIPLFTSLVGIVYYFPDPEVSALQALARGTKEEAVQNRLLIPVSGNRGRASNADPKHPRWAPAGLSSGCPAE